ncbi:hypothetical protein ES703_51973 [subsurface metagenome]
MKAFHTIAVPHRDILAGRLTMDVFAADLWEVSRNRGPDEYKNSDIFFGKTYLTQGLQNLLDITQRRLQGKGGDSVIQVQTPFGGGKTHSLIAMYHKAVQWQAKVVVVVGTALSANTTIWSLLEKSLEGKIERMKGFTAPGKEAIGELLSAHQPVLILMDELLEYVTKAAGKIVGESTLAAQTIAFIQELTETVSALEKACLVVTLPSSILEHYDESAEKQYQQLQKVSGRIEKIYTPIEDREISSIIRKRLFASIDENGARETVEAFLEYGEREGILPQGVSISEYKSRFMDSYPFMPEVIDTLYQRWGSFPTFQRTRGVLRLLSLLVHNLKSGSASYISLSDFDLSNQEIRQELLKHIGAEYNSVIASDITDRQSGSPKVSGSLGNAYQGLDLGTRSATAIFLYSFSGGTEHGTTLWEVKRSATTMENPSSVVAEAVDQLKGKLFYLQSVNEKLFFSNQPNLNRILLNQMENIDPSQITEQEKELLKESIKGSELKVLIWEDNPGNIVDSEELKLVVLKEGNKQLIKDILKFKGEQTPRTNKNTALFLYPLESEKNTFVNSVRRKLAFESIEKDKKLNLSEDQLKEVKKELKKYSGELKELIRRLYRIVAIPAKDDVKEIDLGIPTYGEIKALDREVYEKLRTEGEILEKIAPLVIREKYLAKKDYVPTGNLYTASLTTAGEPRFIHKSVLERGIVEGVRNGLFGLGELAGERIICRYFKKDATLSFTDREILICERVCSEQEREKVPGKQPDIAREPEEVKYVPSAGIKTTTAEIAGLDGKRHFGLSLNFILPKGKVSSLMGVMNYLQSKYEVLKLEINAMQGEITEQEYEEKILEAFRQAGIELEE